MPALLLSDKAVDTLASILDENESVEELDDVRAQLASSPPAPPASGTSYPPGKIVHHEALVKAAKWAASRQQLGKTESITLSSLLHGAKVAFASKPKPVRSPQLIETLRKIQLAQEQAEYETMTMTSGAEAKAKLIPFGFRRNADKVGLWDSREARSEKEEWDEVRRQLGAIFNVALSVIAVAAAVWWAGGNADPIWKTLVALPLSLLVAVAEIVLYARHWSNVQKRKKK